MFNQDSYQEQNAKSPQMIMADGKMMEADDGGDGAQLGWNKVLFSGLNF